MTHAATAPTTAAPAVVELGADLSPVVKAIETAYRSIQKMFPGTPAATIVVKRDMFAWGHTTVAKTWSPAKSEDITATHYEIMISGENLRRGAVFVAATLLHEAAHAHNLNHGILDCDSNGRHNQKFKARAEVHGLTVENTGWGGWTSTSLDEAGQARHKALIATIKRGLDKSAAAAVKIGPTPKATKPLAPTAAGGVSPIAPPKRGNRNLLLATCACDVPNKLRASRGVLDLAKPTCQVCNEPFTT